jgi:hypothetical protein
LAGTSRSFDRKYIDFSVKRPIQYRYYSVNGGSCERGLWRHAKSITNATPISWLPRMRVMVGNLPTDAASLKTRASAFRRLAAGLLGGEFRRRLLELALEYERHAARLERREIRRASLAEGHQEKPGASVGIGPSQV